MTETVSELLKQLLTVKDMMRWGASEFMRHDLSFSHGMETALDESVYLVLKALSLPIDTPDVYWDARLTSEERKKVLNLLIERVEKRLPAAYLTNEGWFAGLPFFIDERVLIPRSPIAELVEDLFEPWVDEEEVMNVLDMATGSGCIGIACSYAFPQAHIDLVDISEKALEVAHINIDRHSVKSSVSAIQSDLYAYLQSTDSPAKQYDIIVSNPPYVDQEDMSSLAEEFFHEPRLALESGQDGLDFTRRLLLESADYLTENGVLVVEVGNSQYALTKQYPKVPFHWFEFKRGGDGVFLLTKQQLELIKP